MLDASESLLEAGRAVAAAKALHPKVEIVVVAEDAGRDGGTPTSPSTTSGREWTASSSRSRRRSAWSRPPTE